MFWVSCTDYYYHCNRVSLNYIAAAQSVFLKTHPDYCTGMQSKTPQSVNIRLVKSFKWVCNLCGFTYSYHLKGVRNKVLLISIIIIIWHVLYRVTIKLTILRNLLHSLWFCILKKPTYSRIYTDLQWCTYSTTQLSYSITPLLSLGKVNKGSRKFCSS